MWISNLVIDIWIKSILHLKNYLVKTKAEPPQNDPAILPVGLLLLNFDKHKMVLLFILFFQSFKFLSAFAIEYLVKRQYYDNVEDHSYNLSYNTRITNNVSIYDVQKWEETCAKGIAVLLLFNFF